jgi:hypothetical protein
MRKYEKDHPARKFELNASENVIVENVKQDASQVAARILEDVKTGGTPRSDPVLRAAVQKLAIDSSRFPPNRCYSQMMQALDDLQLGKVTAAQESALQGKACYDGSSSEPRQTPAPPVLSGQVTEITADQAKVLRANGQAIDWTPFFDALGEKQRQSIESMYWGDFANRPRATSPCVPTFAKPADGFVVHVKGKYTVKHGSSTVTSIDLQVEPAGCSDVAQFALRSVAVPLSLWPQKSQLDTVQDISLEYSLTFHGSSITSEPVQRVSADHAYFEVAGRMYHYKKDVPL